MQISITSIIVNIFYLSLMREVRAALDAGTFGQFRARFKVERVRRVGEQFLSLHLWSFVP